MTPRCAPGAGSGSETVVEPARGRPSRGRSLALFGVLCGGMALAPCSLPANSTPLLSIARAAGGEDSPASAHFVGASTSAPPLAATAFTLKELEGLSQRLSSSAAGERQAAFEALLSLGEDALPAVGSRLSSLAQRGIDQEGVLLAWTDFRKVQGVDAPDGPVDLAKGALPSLARGHGPAAALGAELIALLRALEAQRSPEAAELIVAKLLPLSSKLFRYEAPRIRERLSVLLLPALIRYQNNGKPWVRAFCQESLKAMAISSPGRAVQQDDVALLAAILRAYGDTLTFDAMPAVVTYVTDERLEVQQAARKAVSRFGRNAIWQIRERYVNATGKDAGPNWSHQRILNELYKLHDEPKQRVFDAEFSRAERALAADNVQEASLALDAALRAAPSAEQATRTAPLFARLGEHALSAQKAETALTHFRRARRLAPNAPQAPLVQARIAYLQGELRLADGILDLTSFEHATQLDPSFGPAESALDELSGARAERDTQRRRLLGFVAAFLMALGGVALVRTQVRYPQPPNRALSDQETEADVDGQTEESAPSA